MDEVTFNVPAAITNELAIPSSELAESCNEVPFNVALYKPAIPLREEVPVKVQVPAEAEKLPVTLRPEAMEKLTAVLIDPVADNK